MMNAASTTDLQVIIFLPRITKSQQKHPLTFCVIVSGQLGIVFLTTAFIQWLQINGIYCTFKIIYSSIDF